MIRPKAQRIADALADAARLRGVASETRELAAMIGIQSNRERLLSMADALNATASHLTQLAHEMAHDTSE